MTLYEGIYAGHVFSPAVFDPSAPVKLGANMA